MMTRVLTNRLRAVSLNFAIVLGLAIALGGCAVGRGARATATTSADTGSAAPPASAAWLNRLNGYRAAAGVPRLKENPKFSAADLKHARYLVKNQMTSIKLGLKMHDEDSTNRWYSPEGKEAAHTSDVIPPSKVALGDDQAIDLWLSAPFHALPMFDPELREAGYGKYCEGGFCAAALRVGRGEKWARNAARLNRHFDPQRQIPRAGIYVAAPAKKVLRSPIEFPPQGATLTRGTFDSGEWPDPLASCPGYKLPTGFPIIVSFGTGFIPFIASHSLTSGGRNLEHCVFTAKTYANADPVQQKTARGNLKLYAAMVIVPRKPLAAGRTYSVSVTRDRQVYRWSFKVGGPAPIVTK